MMSGRRSLGSFGHRRHLAASLKKRQSSEYLGIFRDPSLNGWGKALWLIFLVFLPFLAAFIYLIARGRGMTERRIAESKQAQEQANAYIREVAGTSPTSEIESAKKLLDSGAITQAEFDALKAKALA